MIIDKLVKIIKIDYKLVCNIYILEYDNVFFFLKVLYSSSFFGFEYYV